MSERRETIEQYHERMSTIMGEKGNLKGKVCYENLTFGYPIRLIQNGKDKFTVVYGLQVKSDLSYGQAAKEFGCAIMHALAYEGKLDNDSAT